MRRLSLLVVFVLVAGLATLAAQPKAEKAADPIAGSWAGTYAGDSSGKYTMSIQREAAGALAGSIVATTGEGDTESGFKSIVVDGNKVIIKYVVGEGQTEVVMEGTLDGEAIKGSWKAMASGTTDPLQSGTFEGSRTCGCN